MPVIQYEVPRPILPLGGLDVSDAATAWHLKRVTLLGREDHIYCGDPLRCDDVVEGQLGDVVACFQANKLQTLYVVARVPVWEWKTGTTEDERTYFSGNVRISAKAIDVYHEDSRRAGVHPLLANGLLSMSRKDRIKLARYYYREGLSSRVYYGRRIQGYYEHSGREVTADVDHAIRGALLHKLP